MLMTSGCLTRVLARKTTEATEGDRMTMLLLFILGIVLGIVVNPLWFILAGIAIVVIAVAAFVD